MSKNILYTRLDTNQTIKNAFVDADDAHRVVPMVDGEPVGPANPLPITNLPTNPIFVQTLPFPWEYFTLTLSNGNTRETYAFKVGGPSGTPSGTVVLNYTDSSRNLLTDGQVTVL